MLDSLYSDPVPKKGAPKAGDKRQVLPTKNNNGWRSSYLPGYSVTADGGKTVNVPGSWTMPTDGDVATRNTASPFIDDYSAYIASPLYKQRLQGMGVENPDQVVKDRLKNLKNTEFYSNAKDNGATNYIGDTPQVQAPASQPYIVAHETGHVTNINNATGKSSMDQATGSSISPREAWFMVNNSTINPTLKKEAYNNFVDNAKYGSYGADPVAAVLQGKDDHGASTSEWKSDLEAVRYLLHKNGYTKNFGDNLSDEVIQKAMNDPKVKGEAHFQRLLKSFTPANLKSLNNRLAYQGGGMMEGLT